MQFPKKQLDNRKKNPDRTIKKSVIEEVKDRDRVCIICKERSIEEIHHAYYGGQKQLDEGRNGADRLVGLCHICHDLLHFHSGNDYRQFCITYLEQCKNINQ